jgi:phosphatidylglycerol:prolipoprotein diacylglycerol transferase
MHPTICTIGPFTIYSYGLMLAIAFSVSSTLAMLEAKKNNIATDIIFNLTFIGFACGIIGARLFYVAQNLVFYKRDPIEILMLQHGGLSWFGGLIFGSLSGIIYLKNKKLAVYKILDLIIPFVALGQAIGRIGCLLNGCCFGKESAFGIYFPVHQAILVPVQIYSSLLLIFIFIILRVLQDRPHIGGKIFYVYLLLYSLKRFFIEFWRQDNPVIFSGLTLFQILSIALFCLATVKLILIRRTRHHPH